MLTKQQIANLGLSKISSSKVTNLFPPTTALERHISEGYEHWRRTELQKHRWVFAIEDDYQLTLSDVRDDVELPYSYILPDDCLRPLRTNCTEWKQRGRTLHSARDALRLSYVRDVQETEFDPLFVEVLAARIAVESVEYVTQSNTKAVDVQSKYAEAVADAKRNNAFVVGPEYIASSDEGFPFITGRY